MEEEAATQHPWILPVALSIPVVPAAVTLAASTRVFYRHVDIAHPVYAVLMQEVAVLAALSWATLACLLLSLLMPAAKMVGNAFLTLGVLTHQVSWLVVTALRCKDIHHYVFLVTMLCRTEDFCFDFALGST